MGCKFYYLVNLTLLVVSTVLQFGILASGFNVSTHVRESSIISQRENVVWSNSSDLQERRGASSSEARQIPLSPKSKFWMEKIFRKRE